MRIVFMGTPDFAVPALLAICEAGHEVVAVYTQPPREAGRGMKLRRSPVHEAAEEAAIPVLTPESLKAPGEAKRFGALGADAAVVVAYGLILPTDILEAPPRGVDRKSTRLNSSHLGISYAVFCLKKKRIIIIDTEYRYRH